MPREVGPQIVGSGAPLVDRTTPVMAGVVEAARRDLNQPLVEACVRAFAVGRPLALPGLVRVPVAPAVKKLDPLHQKWVHRNNPVVADARSEYSRVNLS